MKMNGMKGLDERKDDFDNMVGKLQNLNGLVGEITELAKKSPRVCYTTEI